MSEQAGAANSNDGAALAGVTLTPLKGLKFDLANQYGVNTFNTIYADVDYLFPSERRVEASASGRNSRTSAPWATGSCRSRRGTG